MTFHFQSRYLDDDGIVHLGRYHDGSIAIELFSPHHGPLSKPTVCLSESGQAPAEGNVFVTDNNSPGIVANLQRLGIIGGTIRTVEYGPFGCLAHECELLVTPDTEGVRAL